MQQQQQQQQLQQLGLAAPSSLAAAPVFVATPGPRPAAPGRGGKDGAVCVVRAGGLRVASTYVCTHSTPLHPTPPTPHNSDLLQGRGGAHGGGAVAAGGAGAAVRL